VNRTATLLLSILYVLASAKIAVNIHFCKGEFEYIELLALSGSCCCDEMQDMHNCCEDKMLLFQIDEEQHSSQSLKIFPVPVVNLKVFTSFNSLAQATKDVVKHQHSGLPPPKGPPIYILHTTLLYYG